MLTHEEPKPVQAYFAFVERILESFIPLWNELNSTFADFNSMHPEVSQKLESFSYQTGQWHHAIIRARARSVAVLIGLRNELIEELRGAVATLELMGTFAQTTSAYAKTGAVEGPLQLAILREDLENLELSLVSLSATQATVSEHARVSVDEYKISSRSHRQIEEFRSDFYVELLAVRDSYFEDASLENLRRYIALAQKLAEEENLLMAYSSPIYSVQHTEGADARAVALLDTLIRDELMAGLIQNREELSHAE